MKLSIIIPVYNVKTYLEECILSILKQNYTDYEIIIVDDGSTDGSSVICDIFGKKYNNIRVFHKKNGGLSDARNFGINCSLGEYLMFVDSDDYLEEGSLEKLGKKMNYKTDVIITRFTEVSENNKISRDNNIVSELGNGIIKDFDAVRWIMKDSFNTWPAQKYIVSREFVNKNKLRFRYGFLHEDLEWTSILCACARTFIATDAVWYNHRITRKDSITNTVSQKSITHVIDMANDLVLGNKLNLIARNDRLVTIIKDRIIESLYSSTMKYYNLKDDEKEYVVSFMYKNIILYSKCKKVKHKAFYFLMKTIGIKNAFKVISYMV